MPFPPRNDLFTEIRLYLKLRPDLNRLKELSRMKLSVNVIGQMILTGMHAANALSGFVPHNDQFYVASLLGLLQLAISVLAHFRNPDGSPASIPYGLTDDQIAEYQKIFSTSAKAVVLTLLAIGLCQTARAQSPFQPAYY